MTLIKIKTDTEKDSKKLFKFLSCLMDESSKFEHIRRNGRTIEIYCIGLGGVKNV